ncbi:hypothetical protein HK102_009355 [Quaeritorhiza haematococci]|nr:hypothetical protein HK102_009355 [Quaeritorhiza haematococci]
MHRRGSTRSNPVSLKKGWGGVDMEESPVNKANGFANAAEEYLERGQISKAIEAHFRAAEQYLIATNYTNDSEAIRTLKLLYADHTRKGKELQRRLQQAGTSSSNSPPTSSNASPRLGTGAYGGSASHGYQRGGMGVYAATTSSASASSGPKFSSGGAYPPPPQPAPSSSSGIPYANMTYPGAGNRYAPKSSTMAQRNTYTGGNYAHAAHTAGGPVRPRGDAAILPSSSSVLSASSSSSAASFVGDSRMYGSRNFFVGQQQDSDGSSLFVGAPARVDGMGGPTRFIVGGGHGKWTHGRGKDGEE